MCVLKQFRTALVSGENKMRKNRKKINVFRSLLKREHDGIGIFVAAALFASSAFAGNPASPGPAASTSLVPSISYVCDSSAPRAEYKWLSDAALPYAKSICRPIVSYGPNKDKDNDDYEDPCYGSPRFWEIYNEAKRNNFNRSDVWFYQANGKTWTGSVRPDDFYVVADDGKYYQVSYYDRYPYDHQSYKETTLKLKNTVLTKDTERCIVYKEVIYNQGYGGDPGVDP